MVLGMAGNIDMNSDMGESFGVYRYGADEGVLPVISSANVACGFHAGDPSVMRTTLKLAQDFGVRVGAHIGFPDRLGFGRRYMDCSPQEAHDYALYQLGAMYAFAKAQGIELSHVKLHGAFYMMALRDAPLAQAIVQAIRSFDAELLVYTIEGSALAQAAGEKGMRVISEYFADRPYHSQGVKMFGWTLEELGSPDDMADRVVSLVTRGEIRGLNEEVVKLRADSVCVHSDTPGSVRIVQAIRRKLEEINCKIASPLD
ncbi:5-oxoprolinase subunit PxpA [Alicyclobacillus tolerans]|uniref:5-oxoprolinase subunit PxpA n=1 Tax=Alicyclobacillus tolerans TaxID=90970 RepID=UPI001F163D6B|nr:5-oxoprolinase subunit PxpA [Alicyclobacillus tolerans]MCF8563204.1 5-oxoprolinase subunit PxpA [Alicyclobacillus tolerans]